VADDPINSKGELTTVQRGAIGDFVRRCWSTDPAMLDLDRMEVLLTVTTDGAGVVRRAVVAQDDVARVNSNPRLKIMAQRAVRAVLDPNCADLPLPQQMLGGSARFNDRFGWNPDIGHSRLRRRFAPISVVPGRLAATRMQTFARLWRQLFGCRPRVETGPPAFRRPDGETRHSAQTGGRPRAERWLWRVRPDEAICLLLKHVFD
jgi:hypothetical protein